MLLSQRAETSPFWAGRNLDHLQLEVPLHTPSPGGGCPGLDVIVTCFNCPKTAQVSSALLFVLAEGLLNNNHMHFSVFLLSAVYCN